MHRTRIKWAYYCTFRSPIAPDLGTMRAVITGWAALILSGYLISLPLYRLYSRALLALGLGPLWFWWWHYYTYPVMFVPCIGGFLSGWLVARFHRTYRVTMVAVYAVSVLLTS